MLPPPPTPSTDTYIFLAWKEELSPIAISLASTSAQLGTLCGLRVRLRTDLSLYSSILCGMLIALSTGLTKESPLLFAILQNFVRGNRRRSLQCTHYRKDLGKCEGTRSFHICRVHGVPQFRKHKFLGDRILYHAQGGDSYIRGRSPSDNQRLRLFEYASIPHRRVVPSSINLFRAPLNERGI